jgi:nicotinamide mononucleotide adenylyltransferase
METINLSILKQLCRNNHIKNYSKLCKKDTIDLINKYHSCLKIQRFLRKFLSRNSKCPISLDPISYPCYAYRPNRNRECTEPKTKMQKIDSVLVYYNIEPLKNFLISTGDFRDPSTRILYTESDLIQIDKIDDWYRKIKKIKEERPKKKNSVYSASKNKKFYRKNNDIEYEVMLLDRHIDDITRDIRNTINDISDRDNINKLNTEYLINYRLQFRRLMARCRDSARYTINKTIRNINFEIQNGIYAKKQLETRDHAIHFLYQLSEELNL